MSGAETHRGILVGVDGSASSMAAVNWAARDAAMRNVPLTLIHVIAPVVAAAAPWPKIPIPQDYFERQDEKARRILEDARLRWFAMVQFGSSPARSIATSRQASDQCPCLPDL
jgi:nucleotide-binding universal stress UspA family protein